MDARVGPPSSAAIYGAPDDFPIPEDAPKALRSPCGVEKLAADHYTRQFHDLHGLDTVVLRPFNVYGPGQTREYAGVISTLEQASAGEPITVHGDGTQTRNFVHVDDVVSAFKLAASTEHVGQAFNIVTGDGTSIRNLARTVWEVADSDSEIIHIVLGPAILSEAALISLALYPCWVFTPTLASKNAWLICVHRTEMNR